MTRATRFDPSRRLRFLAWLQNSEKAYGRWQGRTLVAVAWVALMVAAIHPPHGTGVSVCWFKNLTGLACPGCGLTRSFSSGLRGMFVESWQYHPFGLFILGLFLVTAFVSVSPRAVRLRFAALVESHALFFNALYVVFVASFLGFGLVRALIELGQRLGL